MRFLVIAAIIATVASATDYGHASQTVDAATASTTTPCAKEQPTAAPAQAYTPTPAPYSAPVVAPANDTKVVAPQGGGVDAAQNSTAPQKCQVRPVQQCSNSSIVCACQQYAAVMYTMDQYAGYKNWVDGQSGECRGLNGTAIGSIAILAAAGGDAIYSKAIPSFGQGVQLTFYPQWNCEGDAVLQTSGDQSSVKLAPQQALSVRLSCNGKNTNTVGQNVTAPVSDRFSAVVFQKTQNQGIHSWVDGVVGECRGVSGNVTVGSIQYVTVPGADPVTQTINDQSASQVKMVFFGEFGCLGSRMQSYTGNQKDICKGQACPVPKSVMFMAADGVMNPKFTAQSTTFSVGSASQSVASVVGLVVSAAIAILA